MKLQFKHQKFQEDAVFAVCDCFTGQPFLSAKFLVDQGNAQQLSVFGNTGFGNAEIKLRDDEILKNTKEVQLRNSLIPNRNLEKLNDKPAFTVEMETGTGKTYVYIKTMYELAKRYGWTKFIVVVPSIAIREGVLKTFQITAEHFAGDYGKKARFFVYNSARLNELDQFASDSGINVMIINTQAFAAAPKNEGELYNKAGNIKDQKLKIYQRTDSFQSRKPIDIIKSVNPILIIDEPQSVLGEEKKPTVTRKSIQEFNPLFYITYSATHRENFNMVYRLDAVDAYQKQLVKKISVKGISIKGSTATTGYLYLQKINVYPNRKPDATVVIEYNATNSTEITKKIKKLDHGSNIYNHSGEIESYRDGFVISEINAAEGYVEFTGGLRLSVGECVGETHADDLRRIQIRETIASHIAKERQLFKSGVKVLSLFFIDEVEKYRTSNKDDAEKSFYAETFEKEYEMAIEHLFEELPIEEDDEYRKFLKKYRQEPHKVHAGYFSGDPKTGKFKVNEKVSSMEKDESAYDLIMKDKERLLSFDEPVRFIFSHSALKEGWDNPNVFQICTLRDQNSDISKRQSIGRGLRLCVNKDGERQDAEILGNHQVQEVNTLTVVANESYEDFALGLQSEYEEVLENRPKEISTKLFTGRTLVNAGGETKDIDADVASDIYQALKNSGYVADKQFTDEWHTLSDDLKVEKITELLSDEMKPFAENIIKIAETVYNGKKLPFSNERKKATLLLDDKKFRSDEFKGLWEKINAKSFYTVDFDDKEFVEKAANLIDRRLSVTRTVVQITEGTMQTGKEAVKFNRQNTKTEDLTAASSSTTYDLIGELTEKTDLTRKMIGDILAKIQEVKFDLFAQNPEEFILETAKLINEQKAVTIIEKITYDKLSDTWDAEAIFADSQISGEYGTNIFDQTDADGNHIPLKKHLYDKLRYDSVGEKDLAEKMETAEKIKLYVKLPSGFYINTPMNRYTPDWAVVFDEDDKKHIYFVAESKFYNSLELELRENEKAKIECAKKHFAKISNNEVKYDVVDSFETLLGKIRS
jgi:type III restriction enzyme